VFRQAMGDLWRHACWAGLEIISGSGLDLRFGPQRHGGRCCRHGSVSRQRQSDIMDCRVKNRKRIWFSKFIWAHDCFFVWLWV